VLPKQTKDPEANIICPKLVKKLEIPLISLARIGFKDLHMVTADRNWTPVNHFVQLVVTCAGIRREIWAVVRPEGAQTGPSDVSLLLGIPWLWDVHAYLGIRDGRLTIGDVARGETPTTIYGPAMTLDPNCRLRLVRAPQVPPLAPRFTEVTDSEDYDTDVSSSSVEDSEN
jgi:hypothetical protein